MQVDVFDLEYPFVYYGCTLSNRYFCGASGYFARSTALRNIVSGRA